MKDSGQSAGWPPQFLRDRSAQSETIGVVLVLAITIFGTTALVVYGSQALDDTKAQSDIQSVQNSMTLFDSAAATVGLGDSAVKTVDFGQSQGSFAVDPNAGHIVITHVDYDGTTDETLYEANLGAVVYQNGDQSVAYQGGGVWYRTASGTTMVSPPEFHFREATLTLPMVLVKGSGSANGDVGATIEGKERGKRVYPATNAENSFAPYDNGNPYSNPVIAGKIRIEITSEYAKGWAYYFKQRTDGTVSVSGDTVTLTLDSPQMPGSFHMPPEGDDVVVHGMGGGHPNVNFQLTLKPDGHFNNMHWSLYATDGTKQFEIHLYSSGKCQNKGGYNGDMAISIYYSDSAGHYEGWQKTGIDPSTSSAVDLTCDPAELSVDLTNSEELTYEPISVSGSSNKWHFGNEIKSKDHRPTTVTFDAHTSDNRQYDEGSTVPMDFLVNHYLSLMGPDFDLVVSDGPGGSSRVDEDTSTGHLTYDTGGSQYITYLHISENKIEVRFG